MTRTRFLVPILAGLLALTACDDPSNVGIGLVEEGGGEPIVRVLTPSVIEEEPINDITGAVPRVLAGQVNDPMLGTITATGYLDFQRVDSVNASDITGVMLRLVRDYVYGDTLAALTLTVRELTEDWNALGARADTTLPLGASVTSFTFEPLDSLVTVDLPETWVRDNDTTLVSFHFGEVFHGFALEATAAEAVVGFDFNESVLRITTEQDTLDYPVSLTLSGVIRTGQPTIPEGRFLIQDGTGPTLSFNVDFDGLDDTPLNAAFVRFFADTLAVQETPPNFVRPLIETLQLVRITEEDAAFVMAEASLNDDGSYRFSDAILREVLQQTFFGQDLYDHFALRIPFTDNTISVMLLFDAASDETAPEVLLTLSPSS